MVRNCRRWKPRRRRRWTSGLLNLTTNAFMTLRTMSAQIAVALGVEGGVMGGVRGFPCGLVGLGEAPHEDERFFHGFR